MDKWTNLDSTALANEVAGKSKLNEPFNGRIVFSLPPYDIPKSMRAFIENAENEINSSLQIEFQYEAITERRNVKRPKPGFSFDVGEKTGRLYKVKIAHSMLPANCEFTIDGNRLNPSVFIKAMDSLLGAEPELYKYEDLYQANKSAIEQFNRKSSTDLYNMATN
ncbi:MULTISPECIES: hypothetical protein [Alteromonas]|jgi:hypothetical protein|uniref:hypothetical protein n=1 Tax=Alteromonas TaxID=226 RepID=UPI00127A59CD|nr:MULTISPECIES: hypothetical protein [Alteromonas]CAI2388217.1 hypothetical protein ALT831_00123 [Alteromonas macleodii]CAI3924898.1 hypothetical protein ALTBGP6_00123 [Alteromonas macleodii]CAI3925072.1 hypothetical protein ALTBGP14_00123 [Alteromonas macleodii]CAI3925124.1 hypothetical protein ALTBGP9_00123 [Alteromonas macleodii]VTO37813.1 hypothetical protein ALTBGP6_00123 [Alteromonas macleodii]